MGRGDVIKSTHGFDETKIEKKKDLNERLKEIDAEVSEKVEMLPVKWQDAAGSEINYDKRWAYIISKLIKEGYDTKELKKEGYPVCSVCGGHVPYHERFDSHIDKDHPGCVWDNDSEE